MYILEYSLIIMANYVKLTIPKMAAASTYLERSNRASIHIFYLHTQTYQRCFHFPYAKTVHSIIPRSHHPSFHVVLNRVWFFLWEGSRHSFWGWATSFEILFRALKLCFWGCEEVKETKSEHMLELMNIFCSEVLVCGLVKLPGCVYSAF